MMEGNRKRLHITFRGCVKFVERKRSKFRRSVAKPYIHLLSECDNTEASDSERRIAGDRDT
ncbi:hypothetical protein FHEFKHOI_00140 [Candidatus Methanoperedenaceae archaeon GB50]|nr:hypothetical protein AIOGIFDO_00142 [Candidatus Methanoperedenaceae archaeon GB37]CAD7768194.1 hypothetical protein FHEFKHOI_00140 [Candidatus Methanoperedenaceae archaeon GB50]CAD7779578.1 MAG: hypothetical protein KBONHNOK_01335 [Candidatus Methanoperedenaceae archaeon GB50]